MPDDRPTISYHHTPDHYTWLAQYTCKSSQETPLVWGHDHDGAYRQLPLSDPSIAYDVLLLTPSGPTLYGITMSYFLVLPPAFGHTTVLEICSQPLPVPLHASLWYTMSMTTDPSNQPTQHNPDSTHSNKSIPSLDST